MKRRGETEPTSVPDWLLSAGGRFLVEVPRCLRWCEDHGWSKLDLLFEARRRHRTAHGISS